MRVFNKKIKKLEDRIIELIKEHEIELTRLKEFYIDKANDAYEQGYDKGFDKGYDSGYDSGYRDGQRREY